MCVLCLGRGPEAGGVSVGLEGALQLRPDRVFSLTFAWQEESDFFFLLQRTIQG